MSSIPSPAHLSAPSTCPSSSRTALSALSYRCSYLSEARLASAALLSLSSTLPSNRDTWRVRSSTCAGAG
jgi:hypothetical protein